jgi:fibronectin-binding autotransporter adhesin
MFQVNAGVDLSLTNLTVRDGRANWGAGIHNQGGTLTISRSTISGNSASGGGGIFNSGTLTVTDSTISNNSTPNGFVSGGG